ncbi:MAG: hypothetical protein ACK5TK_03410 [Betaproteobacteria bacterium]
MTGRKKLASILSVLAMAALPAFAQSSGGAVGLPKATYCVSHNLAVGGGKDAVISCFGVGTFSSLATMYEKGYRVASSGFLPAAHGAGMSMSMYLIIELKDTK